jgi:TolB-like protein
MADRAAPGNHQESANSDTAQAEAARVFISYASQDSAVANSIVENLEKQEFKCWIAPRDVQPGARYADAIVGAINDAKAVVLVLSGGAAASSHVGREIERAASKHKQIVAFRIDAAALNPGLEYFLSESQWIDAPTLGMPAALSKLAAAIGQGSGSSQPLDSPMGRTVRTATAGKRVVAAAAVAIGVAVAIAVAVALGIHLWSSNRSGEQAPAVVVVPRQGNARISDRSIAVLPFADMSEKKDQEYFADGMAEEIIDLLVTVPGIRVIGRTSSFQFKGKSEDLRAIGSTLGAAYVVEGSVRKAGERLRVTAQLIEANDGSHLWSESYDEDYGDVLKVQDQIAASLVRALQVTVGADDFRSRPALTRTEAYDLYLRGRYAFDRFDRPGFEAAAGYFQQSLDLDPSSTRAADWLASTLENLAEWQYVPPIEGFEQARLAAQRALKLNSHSSMAHASLAAINLIYDWDWAAAEREAEQARELDPRSADATGGAGQVQAALGRWEEGAGLLRAAMAIDPLFSGWHELLGNIRLREGRYVEAEAELRKTLQISPTYASGHYYLGRILLAQNKLEAALSEMQQEQPDEGRDAGVAIVYHAMGRRAESDAALARLIQARANDAAFEIAQVHAYRGEVDQAFEWLDRAYGQKDAELFWIKGDPWLKNLESDPRYKAFLKKMSLLESPYSETLQLLGCPEGSRSGPAVSYQE